MSYRTMLATLVAIGAQLAAQPIINNTRLVGSVPLSTTGWVAGNWGHRTATSRFCLQTRSGQGLAIIDTTNPANPVLVSNVPGNVKEVKSYGNYAYASTDSGPTVIVNLTNPSAPTSTTIAQGTHTLGVDGDRLYFNRSVSAANGIIIYSLANPASPQQIGLWSGYAHDSAPKGNICYAFGFVSPPGKILNVANPGSIVQLGTFGSGNHQGDLYVSPSGQKYLYTCDEQTGGIVRVWNVTNPAATVQIGSYVTPGGQNLSVHNIRIKGVYGFVSWYKDGLRVLDFQNPAQPVEVGVYDTNPTNVGGTFSDCWDAYPYHDAIYCDQMTSTTGAASGAYFYDFYPGFGQGSPGTGGQVPTPWWSFGPPSPNNSDFALRLENARPSSVAYLIIGLSKTLWNGLPLPYAVPGAPGVNLNVSLDGLIPVNVDAQGKARFAFTPPAALYGFKAYCQWLVLDPGAPNPLGIAVSRGGDLIFE
jgi:hypothetical protein